MEHKCDNSGDHIHTGVYLDSKSAFTFVTLYQVGKDFAHRLDQIGDIVGQDPILTSFADTLIDTLADTTKRYLYEALNKAGYKYDTYCSIGFGTSADPDRLVEVIIGPPTQKSGLQVH